MSLGDLGSLGSFLAAIAVLITLIFLSRQVKQGNALARLQVRQTMHEHDIAGLRMLEQDLGITRGFLGKEASKDDILRLHYFLTLSMRQREWEWFQYRDGVIDESVFTTYHEVIAIHLGMPITRAWWQTQGRTGLDPAFVEIVDRLLASRPASDYMTVIDRFAEEHRAAGRD